MNDFNSVSNNNQKIIAIAVAVAVHGLVGLGLAYMQMPPLRPLKITPPLQIEFIEPQVINDLESPEPPKPIVAPKVEKKPDPRPLPKQVELKTPPKPEPVKEPPKQMEPPKSEPIKEPPKVIEPPEPEVDLLQQQREAQAKWELQQRIEAQARAEAEARAKAEAREKAEAVARAKAAADAQRAAEQAAKNKAEQGRGTGNVIGEESISASRANASWRRKPNFSNIDAGSDRTKTVSFIVQLIIDEKGNIISATGVSTGLGRRVDRQIENAIKRAAFHPFKDSKGNPIRGKASLPMDFTVR